MNQHYFDVPFAFAGDVTAIPDPLQVGGTVSFTEGWNNNYQRNLSTDPAALPIDRATTNWLFLQITKALQALQQQGVPEFITAANNGGVAFSYGKGAVVLWSASGNAPFNKYVSLTASNTNTPSVGDPQGLTTGWQVEVDPISTSAQASAGTDDASIMTPLKVAQQTALRALLAGNSSQVFNVGPATAGTHAPQLQQMTGRLLRTTVYVRVGGVQNVIVDGAAPTTTAATTFTPLAAMTFAIVEAQGGGGAGGGCGAPSSGLVSMGAPGMCGSYGMSRFTAATIGASQGINVGIAGVGAANGAGSTGGTTSFGALLTAPGGTGGGVLNSATPPQVNGNGSNAAAPTGANLISIRGAAGMVAMGLSTSSGIGGIGGASQFGQGANGPGINTNGVAAVNPGSGGSGTVVNSGGGSATGGNGADGILIVREYA